MDEVGDLKNLSVFFNHGIYERSLTCKTRILLIYPPSWEFWVNETGKRVGTSYVTNYHNYDVLVCN